MYQELSNGMLGFYNCLKIADVPFPLPYAQLLGLLLIAFSCLIPFYAAWMQDPLSKSPIGVLTVMVTSWWTCFNWQLTLKLVDPNFSRTVFAMFVLPRLLVMNLLVLWRIARFPFNILTPIECCVVWETDVFFDSLYFPCWRFGPVRSTREHIEHRFRMVQSCGWG